MKCKDCTEWCPNTKECSQYWGMSEDDSCPWGNEKTEGETP